MNVFLFGLLLWVTSCSAQSTGCDPACSASQVCLQTLNADTFSCVDQSSQGSSSAASAPAPAASVVNTTGGFDNGKLGSTGTCSPTCSAGEICSKVQNSDTYQCLAAAPDGAPSSPSPAAQPSSPVNSAVAAPVQQSYASGLSSGAKAGIAIVVLACAALLATIITVVIVRRQRSYQSFEDEQQAQKPSSTQFVV